MRLGIHIDGNNFFHGTKEANIKADYQRLLSFLVGSDELVYAYFYTGANEADDKQKSFLHWMRRNGFRVFQKSVKQDTNQRWVAHLEVEITTDMLVYGEHVDKILLISGDEDFVYPLKALAAKGKRIVTAGFRNSMANKILDVSDQYIEFDQFIDQIEQLED